MKISGLILCGIAGGIAAYFGGGGAVIGVVIGEIAIILIMSQRSNLS